MNDSNKNYSRAEEQARLEIEEFLKKSLGVNYDESKISIGYPPDITLGNFTVALFSLAKVQNENPAQTAKNLAEMFEAEKKASQDRKILDKAINAGPYLNFFIDYNRFAANVFGEIANKKERFGQSKIGKGKKIMVEYFSPNTNKPITVGHLRNIFLGWSVSKLLKGLGYKVTESTLYNDRGIAITKTMVAYQKWGDGKTPEKEHVKPDKFIGNFYARFHKESLNDPALEKEAEELLRLWEKGDKSAWKLWKKIINWAIKGFRQTLKKIDKIKFDKEYYESAIYSRGKEIVLEGLERGIFKKHQEGYIYAPLHEHNLPDKILLRSDGTSLYIVQDIFLAKLKNRENLFQSIYVVGSEQDLAFRQLFKILEMLGEKFKTFHLSYGMMRLPEGKIKSREGLVKGTAADDLIDGLIFMAEEEIKKRNPDLKIKISKRRARQIALAALKFYILIVDPKSTMVFDPQKSLSFEGKTGPYLQYVYARISSILKKAKAKKIKPPASASLANFEEKNLLQKISQFPLALQEAGEKFDPSVLANYLYDLARAFSAFYENVPVITAESDEKKARLMLIWSVRIVMKKGLGLLGIKAPEKM